MSKGAITTENCSPEDMSYYVMIRETIHGLDNLIESTIHHSVTIITATLSVGITLGVAMGFWGDPNFWGKFFLLFVTVIAIILTYSSSERVGLYANLLVENVDIAKKLEDELILDINTNSDNSQKDKKDKVLRLPTELRKTLDMLVRGGKKFLN